MIVLTLTNTGEYNPNDYVSVNFMLEEESTWMDIVNKITGSGLPALGFVLPDSKEALLDMLTDSVDI